MDVDITEKDGISFSPHVETTKLSDMSKRTVKELSVCRDVRESHLLLKPYTIAVVVIITYL